MSTIELFNTLTRKTETFTPVVPGQVRLYCCGPTVYNFQHIGNMRTYIFEDMLVRMLRSQGLQVEHVMNITDVGHLTSDADEGEDKMAIAAKREKKTSLEIAQYYTDIFFADCDALNVSRPNIVCRATEHIGHMISLIKDLEAKGAAYTAGGNVYFDIAQFPAYGALAKLNLESLQAGARIEVDQGKRHPADFALWFTKSKFENQELQWDSPWGVGYPGWHIECSAMAMHYLGQTLDIHCGGIDHISVHHTNEIAQSEAATGKPFARFWMHGAFLNLGKEKMSKSTGDFLTLAKVTERGLDPLSYRLFCLSAHYRQELAWSWDAVTAADTSLKRIRRERAKLAALVGGEKGKVSNPALGAGAQAFADTFWAALCNDLGTPRAIAELNKVLSNESLTPAEKLMLINQFDDVLGLQLDRDLRVKEEASIPDAVHGFVRSREAARSSRDWKEADRLRAEIRTAGFDVEDTKSGSLIKRL